MNDDRSLERAARSWIEEGPTRAPDRSVEAALAVINTTAQERDPRIPWRLPSMFTNRAAIAALAIVIIVAGAGFALSGFGSGIGGPGGPSEPRATPVPSPSPRAITLADVGTSLQAGTYKVEGFAVPFTIELPEGWEATELTSTSAGFADSRDATFKLFLAVVNKVYTDPCLAAGTSNRPIPVRPGVDALVTAMSSMEMFRVSAAAATRLGGASGQVFTFGHVRGLICGDTFPIATYEGDGKDVDIAMFSNEPDRFWVVDAEGTTVLMAITSNTLETVQPVLETLSFLEAST